MTDNTVCFRRNAQGQFTQPYTQLWQAASQAKDMCAQKCRAMVQDSNESPSQVVYALAGLKFCMIPDREFNNLLAHAAGRPGTFTYSNGRNDPGIKMQMGLVRTIFDEFNQLHKFESPTGAPLPHAPPPPPPVATARAPAPQHRPPTCDSGHRMEVQLLHVSAFCDQCKMPLPETVPAWSCERCDADLCFPCAIRKFAPQVLAGGASGPVPIGGGGLHVRPNPAPVHVAHGRGRGGGGAMLRSSGGAGRDDVTAFAHSSIMDAAPPPAAA